MTARGARRRAVAVLGPLLLGSALSLPVDAASRDLPVAAVDGAGSTTPSSRASEEGSAVSAVLGLREVGRAVPGAGSGDRARTSLWGWPLLGTPTVVRGFDPPERRWLAGHRGIDLAGVAGEPVLAVDDGVVAFSGTVAGTGVVSVDHAGGLRSTYQPVTDPVARGARVGRGDRLGTLDVGGHCLLADCLHLGARRGRDHYVDPTPLLHPVELSLLPLGPSPGAP